MNLSDLVAEATARLNECGDMKVFVFQACDTAPDDPEEASSAEVKNLEFRAGIGFEAFVISN